MLRLQHYVLRSLQDSAEKARQADRAQKGSDRQRIGLVPHALRVKATANSSYIQEAVPCRHTTLNTAIPCPLISMHQHTPTTSIFRTTPPDSNPLSIEGKIPFCSPNTKSLMQIHPPKPSLLSSKLHTITSTKQRKMSSHF
jgi:hypothetical protein